jgi:nicotinate-nucleotide--dimethylbenzimidazole phosphoribosyltransferase
MVYNILDGGAAINVLTRHTKSELNIVDIGVKGKIEHLALINKKIKHGTNNIAKNTAMTLDETYKALEIGIEQAQNAKTDQIDILATGEMGIGNTTSASALLAELLPCSIEDITGKGTGISDKQLKHKINIIKKTLEINKNNFSTPLETLAAIGGLEIAGITGLIIGAVANRIPVVVDGFISSAAALVACRMNSNIKDYLFFSHLSAEKGHKTFYDLFNVQPTIDLQMRLGEGTGATLTINLIEASVKIYNEMATFETAGVSNND